MKIQIKIVIQIYLHIKRISKSWLCYLYKICMRKLLSDQKTVNKSKRVVKEAPEKAS